MFIFFYQLGPKLCCSNNTTGPYYICILYIWVKCTMALPKYSIPVYIYIYIYKQGETVRRSAAIERQGNRQSDKQMNRQKD